MHRCPEMNKHRSRVFYGWWTLLIIAFALFLGPAPTIVFSYGVFLKALSREFHSGRGAISFGFTLHNLAGALSAPLAGRLVDRFGARKVLIPSTAIFGTILLSSELCSGKLWQLYLFYLAAGLIGSGLGVIVYAIVASHWFDRRRGLARRLPPGVERPWVRRNCGSGSSAWSHHHVVRLSCQASTLRRAHRRRQTLGGLRSLSLRQ